MFYNLTNSKIFERITKVIHKPEEIQEEDEITPYYKNKYVVIGGLLIISSLA
jgi:hypothetical protein